VETISQLIPISVFKVFFEHRNLLARLFCELAPNQKAVVAQLWVLEFPVFKVKYTNLARLFR